MSGSGGSAFLDLLRRLSPASFPAWALALAAALISVAVSLACVAFVAWVVRRMERRASGPPAASNPARVPRMALALAQAGILGAVAAYPFSPHVFFAQLGAGMFAALALGSLALLPLPWLGERVASVLAAEIALALALLVPVAIGGTLDWIEASRLQSGFFGMGWFVLQNPFGLPALCVCLFAAIEVTRHLPREGAAQPCAMFLASALVAVSFLGGFESPLTWSLRQSLGLDPGFLNHVQQADGSVQDRIAFGGLVFQVVCALTLLAKALLGVWAMLWLRSTRLPRVERLTVLGANWMTPIALASWLGAAAWEWARVFSSAGHGP